MHNDLDEWRRFLRTHSHVLLYRPHLLFQQAANQPDFSALALAAARRLASGAENRRWLKWINKPQLAAECLATLLGHTGQVRTCTFSPNGDRLVSGATDATLRIWDVESARETAVLAGHTDVIMACAFSPLGDHVTSASADQTVKVWNSHTGHEIKTLTGHSDVVSACAYSPDGLHLATASYDGTLKIWSTETWCELATLTETSGDGSTQKALAFVACAYLRDGGQLLTATSRIGAIRGPGNVKLWNAQTFNEVATLLNNTEPVRAFALSPDGQRVLLAQNRDVNIFDLQSKTTLLTLSTNWGSVETCTYSPDGTRIITGSSFGAIRIWDAASGEELICLKEHADDVTSCAYSPDGLTFVSASTDRTLKIWNASQRPSAPHPAGHRKRVCTCSTSNVPPRLVTISEDQTIKVWNLENGTETQSISIPSSQHFWCSTLRHQHACAVTSDGERVVSIIGDESLRVWETTTGRELLRLCGHKDRVTACGYSPDERTIFSVSGKSVKIWDASTGSELTSFTSPDYLRDCRFSVDGSRIVTASGQSVEIWDAASGSKLLSLLGHSGLIDFSLYSPDGRSILSAARDRTIRLWDSLSGAALSTIDCESGVEACQYSPDGRTVALGFLDGSLRILEPKAGELRILVPASDNQALTCAFTADGTQVYFTTYDQTVTIWDIATGIQLGCWTWLSRPVVALATAKAGDFIAAAEDEGKVYILHPEGANFHPAVVTLVYRCRLERLGTEFGNGSKTLTVWDDHPTAHCPWCGKQFVPPSSVLETIKRLERDEAATSQYNFEDSELLSNCPNCSCPLRFNPFIVGK